MKYLQKTKDFAMLETKVTRETKGRMIPFSGTLPYFHWEIMNKETGKEKKWLSVASFVREAVEEKLKKEKLV